MSAGDVQLFELLQLKSPGSDLLLRSLCTQDLGAEARTGQACVTMLSHISVRFLSTSNHVTLCI